MSAGAAEAGISTREVFIFGAYLAASVAFILGLKGLTRPDTARRGVQLAFFGMLAAVVGTLVKHEIVTYSWILVGLVVGGVIGWPLGTRVAMTQMPQRIAISHLFGALAASLVGIAEYHTATREAGGVDRVHMAALGFEVLFGSLTVSGSFMAFGKLHEILPTRGITFRFQNPLNITVFFSTVALLVYLVAVDPDAQWAFYAMAAVAFLSGFSMVLPIGGADMPVVVSLLNSYAGLAAAATGFALENPVLIIAGALDGASGFLLSILMSKAMNRSFSNVLFGAFGSTVVAARKGPGGDMKEISVEDAALTLRYARNVVVVPGYGLAVAQAQKIVGELAEIVEGHGGTVRYAIHPVAGRMPGHMNVLLAEANISYEKMVEMEEINGSFSEVDVALVVGANDVVNPAARKDPGSPIYGMPILDVDRARRVFVLKRGKGAGFAGIENDLFVDEKTSLLFGDAKGTLQRLVTELKAMGE